MHDEHDLLDDGLVGDQMDYQYVRASKEKRFANYIVDFIAFFVFAFVFMIIYFFQQSDDFFYEENAAEEDLVINLIFYLGYPLVYAVMEYFTGGKSIGKYITKTKVIRNDGSKLSFIRALGRSFARLIPFEALSIFFNDHNVMWHDSLSDTMVIEE